MPSFDVVSEVDSHELANAVDQANREVKTRFDFKGSDAKFEHNDNEILMLAGGNFQLKQMMDILRNKMIKRGIDSSCIDAADPESAGLGAKQKLTVREGLDKEMAKKVVKLIKEAKLKVQSTIQDKQVRVTSKKRDDLQAVMSMLRESDLDLPLQYTNFRD